MPCECHGMDAADRKAAKDHLDKLTRMLCWLCEQSTSSVISLNRELGEWWEQHRREGSEALARENQARFDRALRRQALARLTPEEKCVLGVSE